MSTLRVTEIQSNSTTFNTAVRFETSGGTENGRLCKAWVNFNGQGTVSIRQDFNVNSVDDLGTGKHRINFSTAMPDVGYCTVLSNRGVDASDESLETTCLSFNTPPTSSNFTIVTSYPGNSRMYDCDIHSCAVFR